MSEPNLLSLSVSAFAAVLLLLSLLALAIRALTMLFAVPPSPTHRVDAAVVAALSSAVHHALPGYRVTRIEEES
jgi:hypothetical protein